MRSNFTLGLAAITLGLGIACTSAAAIDSGMLPTSNPTLSSMQTPHGNFTLGLSTPKVHRTNIRINESLVGLSVTGGAIMDNLVRPEGAGNAWRDKLTALSAASPALKRVDAQQELIPAGEHGGQNGFAAIKAAAGRQGGSDAALQRQLSSADAAASNSLVSAPSK